MPAARKEAEQPDDREDGGDDEEPMHCESHTEDDDREQRE